MLSAFYKKLINASTFYFLVFPLLSFSQPQTITCKDIRNGIFILYSPADESMSTYTRNGYVQKEINPQKHETTLWDVEWKSDCLYTLKYNSGYEDRSKYEIKFFHKHTVVVQILSVTENYYIFKTSMDKASNPTVSTDTLWIKQRGDVTNRTVQNPGIDSILAAKKAAHDSATSNSAVIYVFRPGKLLNNKMSYDLFMNDVALCEMGNKSAYIVRVFKEGMVTFHAKMDNQEASLTAGIEYGKKYYLQCDISWGLQLKPMLTMSNAEEAKPYFEDGIK